MALSMASLPPVDRHPAPAHPDGGSVLAYERRALLSRRPLAQGHHYGRSVDRHGAALGGAGLGSGSRSDCCFRRPFAGANLAVASGHCARGYTDSACRSYARPCRSGWFHSLVRVESMTIDGAELGRQQRPSFSSQLAVCSIPKAVVRSTVETYSLGRPYISYSISVGGRIPGAITRAKASFSTKGFPSA